MLNPDNCEISFSLEVWSHRWSSTAGPRFPCFTKDPEDPPEVQSPETWSWFSSVEAAVSVQKSKEEQQNSL